MDGSWSALSLFLGFYSFMLVLALLVFSVRGQASVLAFSYLYAFLMSSFLYFTVFCISGYVTK